MTDERPPDAPTTTETVAAAAATTLRPVPGMVKLYDPDHEHLFYGPHGQHEFPPNVREGNIEIGVIEPNVALVPVGHPLIQQFLSDHPHAVARKPGESSGAGVYVCEQDDEEFPTKAALAEHRQRTHAITRPVPAARRARPAKRSRRVAAKA